MIYLITIVLWMFVLGPSPLLFLSWKYSSSRAERIALFLMSLSYCWFLAARNDPALFLGPSYSTARFLIEFGNVVGAIVTGLVLRRLSSRGPVEIASAYIAFCWFVALVLSHAVA